MVPLMDRKTHVRMSVDHRIRQHPMCDAMTQPHSTQYQKLLLPTAIKLRKPSNPTHNINPVDLL